MIIFLKSLVMALSFLLVANTSFALALPVEFFAKKSQFNSIKLSPDGEHFAATVPNENTTQLVVFNRKTMKPVINYGFGEHEHIGKFYWLNDQRLVYTKSYQTGAKEQKTNKGEIFSANIDGSKRVQLFGRNSSNSKLKSKRSLNAYGKILHMLPDDKQHILVEASGYNDDSDTSKKIYKINGYNQKRKLITKTPLGNFKLVLTRDGQVFAGSGKDRKGKKHSYFFNDNQWREMPKQHQLNKYSLLSLNYDESTLYLKKSINKGTNGLFAYDIARQEISLLFNDATVDIAELIREPGNGTIVGVETMLDGVKYTYLDEDNAFGNMHRQLAEAFKHHDIMLFANSLADNVVVLRVSSDRIPGDYYLYNRDKQQVDFLLSKKPWLDPNVMMPRKAISFTARDGKTIYGYLTLPHDTTPPYKLIVDVHGGPYGVQDKWHFNTDAQMFANQGYAVLQINFRGSGGYGLDYKKIAYLKRNSLIQHDIIDGTRWALGLNEIDDEKVCIIGGSFGGYSALMAPLVEPELYKCAIPRYGPYDLVYQMQHADYMSKDSVSVGAMDKYGDNEQIWREQSPLTYLEQLQTPLFIVTGGKDTRVPPQSAHNLRAELDKRNIAYQWLYKAKEGHGFTNVDNKTELYKKSLVFIEEHINE